MTRAELEAAVENIRYVTSVSKEVKVFDHMIDAYELPASLLAELCRIAGHYEVFFFERMARILGQDRVNP